MQQQTRSPFLKSAVIGCGRIGVANSARLADRVHPSMLPVSHAECMIATGRLDLVAFCDVQLTKAQEAATAYGRGAAFSDVATMLSGQNLDIVSVATRTQERPEIVEMLARHGVRGIYADKPFSRSLAECKAAMRAVEASGTKLALGTSRRYMQIYRRAREIIDSGRLGRLNQIRIQLDPGTQLLWTVPHFVDLLLYFSGGQEVEYVQATCDIPPEAHSGSIIDCDPVVEAVTVRFGNGILGTLHTTSKSGVALVCERGEIHVFEALPMVRVIHSPSSGHTGLEDELINDSMSGTVRAFGELADAVTNDSPSPVTPADVLFNQGVLVAIAFSSLEGGRRVRLDEVPEDLVITGKVGANFA